MNKWIFAIFQNVSAVFRGGSQSGREKTGREAGTGFLQIMGLEQHRAKEGLKGPGMEAPEAISDLFRVFLPEDVSSPNPGIIPRPSEGDEASPSIIPSKEIQTGSPPSSRHLQPPGLHRHRWGQSAMCRLGCEFLFEMGIQVNGPIRQPNVEGGQRKDLLEVEEEGGQRIFPERDSDLPGPNPGPGIEGADRFLGEDGKKGMGLTATIGPVTRSQLRILRNQPVLCGIPGGVTGSTLKSDHTLG